jgi:hypothetical protein
MLVKELGAIELVVSSTTNPRDATPGPEATPGIPAEFCGLTITNLPAQKGQLNQTW